MSGTHLKGTLRGHEGCGPHKANGFDLNHIFKASNEFSKQVNDFYFKPYVKSK